MGEFRDRLLRADRIFGSELGSEVRGALLGAGCVTHEELAAAGLSYTGPSLPLVAPVPATPAPVTAPSDTEVVAPTTSEPVVAERASESAQVREAESVAVGPEPVHIDSMESPPETPEPKPADVAHLAATPAPAPHPRDEPERQAEPDTSELIAPEPVAPEQPEPDTAEPGHPGPATPGASRARRIPGSAPPQGVGAESTAQRLGSAEALLGEVERSQRRRRYADYGWFFVIAALAIALLVMLVFRLV